ncbi:MAG: hypothetical protein M1832_001528 [Thelocarpon impressellum]|nr:MAG: hypothetical protein M1832_001528 [Thelocarpon impressellum]
MEAFVNHATRDQLVAAAPPPPGVVPNFENPMLNLGPTAPLCVFLMCTATLLVLLRLYTKAKIVRVYGLEDVAVLLAWIFCVVNASIILYQNQNGQGEHIWDVTLSKYVRYSKYSLTSIALYLHTMMFAKVAILLVYRRLSPKPGFRVVVDFVMCAVVVFNIVMLLGFVIGCRPLAKAWDPRIVGGDCVSRAHLFMATCSFNVVSDLVILVLPIPMLASIQMPIRQKVTLGALFGLGSLTCIACILKLKYRFQILYTTDPTWDSLLTRLCILCETHLAVICGCLMVMRPFLRRHVPFLLGSASWRPVAGRGQQASLPWYKGSYASTIWSKVSRSQGMSSLGTSIGEDVERGAGSVELAPAKPGHSNDVYCEGKAGTDGNSESEQAIIVKTVSIDVR